MNTYQNLLQIVDSLPAGVTPKVTKLPTRKPRRGDLVFTSGHRSTGYRANGEKTRGGNGNNAGNKVG